MRPLLLSLMLAFLLVPVPAKAQGCIDYTGQQLILREGAFHGPVQVVVSYAALITERDLYNSRGVRLKDFRAIIQQDRANVHKTGVTGSYTDSHDDGSPMIISEDIDSYFTTLKRRGLLSTARYYQHCGSIPNASLEAEITRGQVQAAILWVVVFKHPNGQLAVLLSPVG